MRREIQQWYGRRYSLNLHLKLVQQRLAQLLDLESLNTLEQQTHIETSWLRHTLFVNKQKKLTHLEKN